MIRETETDPTGTVLKTISYTFDTDELSQTTVNYTNGTPDVPVTLTFAHDGHASVRTLFDVAGAIAHVAGVLQQNIFGNDRGITIAVRDHAIVNAAIDHGVPQSIAATCRITPRILSSTLLLLQQRDD